MNKLRIHLVLAAAAIMVAGCGGGGGGGDTMPAQADPLDALPAEATQSVGAWIGFIDRLVRASGADVREAFAVSAQGVSAGLVDDAAEPAAVRP